MFGSKDSVLPFILNTEDVLVPIRIDVSHQRGRYVDSFCWNLYNSSLTPEEFVWQTCVEDNLPSELIPRIVAQLQEQVAAFHALIALIIASGENTVIRQALQNIIAYVAVRSNTVDYADSFNWDAYLTCGFDPEEFSRQTCADLGLAAEMQPVIALRLRETIIRSASIFFLD
jgi:chromatin structure-remodeling complex subunit SFH1